MRYLIIILAISLLSCNKNNTETITVTAQAYEKVNGFYNPINDSVNIYINGHSYLIDTVIYGPIQFRVPFYEYSTIKIKASCNNYIMLNVIGGYEAKQRDFKQCELTINNFVTL